MKRLFILFVHLFTVATLLAQIGPVANSDYAEAILGDTITINVIENDFHPEGLSFRVMVAHDAISYTDSTITYFFNYDQYCLAYDTLSYTYLLKDENGLIGENGQGKVFISLIDNHYYDYLDQNNIRARIQACGIQFWPGAAPFGQPAVASEFEFPKGSGLNTVFSSSIWVGGLDETGSLKLAAERYRQIGLDFWTGPLSRTETSLSVDPTTAVKWNNVWKLTKSEVQYHMEHFGDEGYQMSHDIATWPAHGDVVLNQPEYLAPFVDVDANGKYEPMAGDYPLIRGDQCVYFIVNDLRAHTESGGSPLGLEIHVMAYEITEDESTPLNNSLFFNYKIFNRSDTTYHDTYIGLFTDFDLGYARDDYVGCDVARGAYYGYNGDSIDGDGGSGTYGSDIPAQGIVILGGPTMDANGVDDPDGMCDESINGVGFGDGIADNERYGMQKFIYFNNGGSFHQSDPQDASEYYTFMQGIWKDGTTMEYGGNGHVSTGAYGPASSFMFPGMSDPCFWGTGGIEPFGPVDWTENSAGNEPEDRRGLSVMGPFTFEPGTMEMVDMVYVSAFAEEGKTAVETLMSFVDVVKDAYYLNPTYFATQWLGLPEEREDSDNDQLKIYPNPVLDMLTIIYEASGQDSEYKLTDITGKVVMAGQLDSSGVKVLQLSALEKGLYLLTIYENNRVSAAKVLKN